MLLSQSCRVKNVVTKPTICGVPRTLTASVLVIRILRSFVGDFRPRRVAPCFQSLVRRRVPNSRPPLKAPPFSTGLETLAQDILIDSLPALRRDNLSRSWRLHVTDSTVCAVLVAKYAVLQ